MNLPNILTLIRIFLVPVFVYTFFNKNIDNNYLIALTVFLFAGITDGLDGFIARKYKLVTKFGTLVDPLADKIMIVTVLFCLYKTNHIPLWVFVVVSLKELFMLFGAAKLYRKDIVVPANYYGKTTTVFFYFAIVLSFLGFLVSKNHNISGKLPKLGEFFSVSSMVFFVLAIIAMIVALVTYIMHYINLKKNIRNID